MKYFFMAANCFIMMVFFTLSFPVVPWKKLKTCSDFLFCNLVKWFGKTLSVFPFYTCKMIWLTFKTLVGFFFFFCEFKNIILVMFELQWFIIVTNIYNLIFCQYGLLISGLCYIDSHLFYWWFSLIWFTYTNLELDIKYDYIKICL